MILLDTHVWIWWVHAAPELSVEDVRVLDTATREGIGISIISCWEVAKLVEYGRLQLPLAVEEWLQQSLAYPGVQLLDLTPRIVVESTRLRPPFHRDPADQLIVATAQAHGVRIATADEKILAYPHVDKLRMGR